MSQVSMKASHNQNGTDRPDRKDALAGIVTLIAIGGFVAFVALLAYLLSATSLIDVAWVRFTYLLTGIETVTFTAVGWLFGREVHREQALQAEKQLDTTRKQAKEQVNDTREQAKGQVNETREQARQQVNEMREQARQDREQAKQNREQAKQDIADIKQELSETKNQLKEQAKELTQQREKERERADSEGKRADSEREKGLILAHAIRQANETRQISEHFLEKASERDHKRAYWHAKREYQAALAFHENRNTLLESQLLQILKLAKEQYPDVFSPAQKEPAQQLPSSATAEEQYPVFSPAQHPPSSATAEEQYLDVFSPAQQPSSSATATPAKMSRVPAAVGARAR